MSTHNICFCREIRQMWILFGGKKRLIKSYEFEFIFKTVLTLHLALLVCSSVLSFTAQSTQWGHVERGQFT